MPNNLIVSDFPDVLISNNLTVSHFPDLLGEPAARGGHQGLDDYEGDDAADGQIENFNFQNNPRRKEVREHSWTEFQKKSYSIIFP